LSEGRGGECSSDKIKKQYAGQAMDSDVNKVVTGQPIPMDKIVKGETYIGDRPGWNRTSENNIGKGGR